MPKIFAGSCLVLLAAGLFSGAFYLATLDNSKWVGFMWAGVIATIVSGYVFNEDSKKFDRE